MLPAVLLHSIFAAAAILLQFFKIVDLPLLINVNNVFLSGLVYTVVLAVLEALKNNRMMMLASAFLVIAYVSMLYNFVVFYGRSGVVPYTYRDTYFLFMLCVLIHDAWLFFKDMLDKVNYDALTGVYNRRYLDESLKRIISLLSRSGSKLSVLMIDVDFFKKYNDTYGHIKGDECLRAVANTLNRSIMRADDFVARYGGEEFAVVLPNTDVNGAHILADRILEYIKACDIPHAKNEAASCVTVSIGATTGEVAYAQVNEDYIKRADEALYMSKQNGRNRYTFLDLEDFYKKQP
jgi:diguanylate cyclase (GGDEF)-like protein